MASADVKTTEALSIPDVLERTTESDNVSQDLKTPEPNRKPRRKPSRFRKIPRSPAEEKENNKGARLAKGGRQRTTSVSSVASGRSQRRGGKSGRRRTPSEASTISEAGEASPLRKLRDTITEKFQKKGLNLLNSYIKNRMELAKFENTAAFLERCDALQIVPNKYRLVNAYIKNTKHVIRTLDRFSFYIMFADLKYNRKRRFQVTKLLSEKDGKMREMFGDELVSEILQIAGEAFERRFSRIREQQTKIFESLLKEYKITEEERAEGEERLKRSEEREKGRQERRSQDKRRDSGDKASPPLGDECVKDTAGDSDTKEDAKDDGLARKTDDAGEQTKSSSAGAAQGDPAAAATADNSEDSKEKDVAH